MTNCWEDQSDRNQQIVWRNRISALTVSQAAAHDALLSRRDAKLVSPSECGSAWETYPTATTKAVLEAFVAPANPVQSRVSLAAEAVC